MRKIFLMLIILTIFLTGCGMENLKYDGKEFRDELELEEYLENKLELDNPQYDIEVSVGQDMD